MNTIAIGAILLAVVFAAAWLFRMRYLKPQMAGYASQRMCPACGLITPRSNPACLECGKVFVAQAQHRSL
jgi:hypothetical protein